MGVMFKDYFDKDSHNGLIDQNCLDMFEYISVIGFTVRFAIFCLCFASYPLINLILRTSLLNAFLPEIELTKKLLLLINASLTLIPLMFAMFFKGIGSVLACTGSLSGLVIIYVLPVAVHLKKRYTQITNPLLAEAMARHDSAIYSNRERQLSRHESKSSTQPQSLSSPQLRPVVQSNPLQQSKDGGVNNSE